MTEAPDIRRYGPPEAPLDMPYQVIERPRAPRYWLALLRGLTLRHTHNE